MPDKPLPSFSPRRCHDSHVDINNDYEVIRYASLTQNVVGIVEGSRTRPPQVNYVAIGARRPHRYCDGELARQIRGGCSCRGSVRAGRVVTALLHE